MKRIMLAICIALMALLLAMPALADGAVGFWYTEVADDGIETPEEALASETDAPNDGLPESIDLLDGGVANLLDEMGEVAASGTYVVDGSTVTITVNDSTYVCVIDGDLMNMNNGQKVFARGLDIQYWVHNSNDSAVELDDGNAWFYDGEGELLSEGTYTMNGDTVTIQVDGKTMTGTINDLEMTLDGEPYSLY
ncbi:hypothetical protein LJC33_03910 [Eubacteriales bacterium OttesenSCG-928-N13]|nr:hypothetical protein [Eubacteriales bacterium OttesenSCG-928-N13]